LEPTDAGVIAVDAAESDGGEEDSGVDGGVSDSREGDAGACAWSVNPTSLAFVGLHVTNDCGRRSQVPAQEVSEHLHPSAIGPPHRCATLCAWPMLRGSARDGSPGRLPGLRAW
jgi:hypothetical protein